MFVKEKKGHINVLVKKNSYSLNSNLFTMSKLNTRKLAAIQNDVVKRG